MKIKRNPTLYRFIKSTGNQMWVEGLPSNVKIITYGADLVNDGEVGEVDREVRN